VYAVRNAKNSQGLQEQPDPVYAEVQSVTTDPYLKMRMNIAHSADGKFEMEDNFAYGSRCVGH